MPLLRSLRAWLRRAPSPAPRRHRWFRPLLEELEDRTVLSAAPTTAAAAGLMAQMPLSFQANQGQAAAPVAFTSQGQGYSLALSATRADLALSVLGSGSQASPTTQVLSMQLVGGNAHATRQGLQQLPGVTNYLTGSDPSKWQTNLTNYGQVEFADVWQGINVDYHGTSQQQLEYDFVVSPGASVGEVQLQFAGQQSMSLDAQGDLVLHTATGDVIEQAPVAYQQGPEGTRVAVAAHYVLEANGRVGIAVGAYNHAQTLIVDPSVNYSSYFGGSSTEQVKGVTTDINGDVVITGLTDSPSFPPAAGTKTGPGGNGDAFVAKFNPDGSLAWYTILGGSGVDGAAGVAVDNYDNVIVTGSTHSTNFPTTLTDLSTFDSFSGDVFVTKFDGNGNLAWSLIVGVGTSSGVATDAQGVGNGNNIYITGFTKASNFPTTTGTELTGQQDAFVTKLYADGSLAYSTLFGGNISKGGGSGDTQGLGIAVDSSGDAYITGKTDAPNLPANLDGPGTTIGTYDAFVASFTTTGGVNWSRYLAGNGDGSGNGIALRESGGSDTLYVTGFTSSSDFPTTAGAYQRQHGQAAGTNTFQDAFVSSP